VGQIEKSLIRRLIHMKVILNQDVPNLGEEGDIVVVKRGYGRNYLLPKGLAVHFNKANQAVFASRAEAIEKRKEEKRKAAASTKERLDEMTLTVVVTAGDTGRLFGSVTSAMIQEALAKEGIEVERKRIEVETHSIRMVGDYKVRVRLYEGETAELNLIVTSEALLKKKQAEEAAAKAEGEEVAAETKEEPKKTTKKESKKVEEKVEEVETKEEVVEEKEEKVEEVVEEAKKEDKE
jgi:large subunit ribosomal protein L9